jgi:lipase chaperone LimK
LPSGHVRERRAILFMSAAGQATAFSGEVEGRFAAENASNATELERFPISSQRKPI